MEVLKIAETILTIVAIFFCGYSACYNDEEFENNTFTQMAPAVHETTFQIPNEKWVVGALKDIAYYLRNYKFNEWDRRYLNKKPLNIGFYSSFPSPPLRSLHWKVYHNCNSDFYKCITYLHSIISTAPFTRKDDTLVVFNVRSRSMSNKSVEKFDAECKKMMLDAERSGLPFDSPLEKFQWRTTASYFMCWYTMRGTPALTMLGESCDNFANCLDPTFGPYNYDVRSDDRLSFSCAMYSFCPDPCCPVKHLKSHNQCLNDESNPCYLENSDGIPLQRRCHFDRSDNQNLEDIKGNRWNVSCKCKEKGFVWKSQFGMCVDNNECTSGDHDCDNRTQDCLNLPGTYRCICKWGYEYGDKKKRCERADFICTNQTKPIEDADTLFDVTMRVLRLVGILN